MAATLLSRSCPIRIIPMHPLDAAGKLLRVLGPQAEVRVLLAPRGLRPPSQGHRTGVSLHGPCRRFVRLALLSY